MRIHRLTTSHTPMFLINSRFPLVSATRHSSTSKRGFTKRAPLLPKLRGHFAEFLNHDYLDRLSILYPTTCVGLGYGRLIPNVEAFLDSIGSPTSTKMCHHQTSPKHSPDLPKEQATSLDALNHQHAEATFLRHPC